MAPVPEGTLSQNKGTGAGLSCRHSVAAGADLVCQTAEHGAAVPSACSHGTGGGPGGVSSWLLLGAAGVVGAAFGCCWGKAKGWVPRPLLPHGHCSRGDEAACPRAGHWQLGEENGEPSSQHRFREFGKNPVSCPQVFQL